MLLFCWVAAFVAIGDGARIHKQAVKQSTAVDELDFPDSDSSIKYHWALLIAGSMGWGNYRHQADVFHAYHVLVDGGLNPSRIIVMAYDDIAHDPENPEPGKVFNMPGGPDVYAGVRIDYKGEDVNPEVFLSVLEGNAAAVANKGSGRVLRSGPQDRVFLFYSDHGAAGVLGMPSGPFLYADQLIATLEKKAKNKGYKEMVMYIEACESGSMFEGLLDNDLSIYVTTAANAIESSWATYCPTFSLHKSVPPFLAMAATGPGALPAANGALHLPTKAPGATTAFSKRGLSDDEILAGAEAILASAAVTANGGGPSQTTAAAASFVGVVAGSSTRPAAAGPVQGVVAPGGSKPHPPAPGPEFMVCLGDLYSVAWMENSEEADLREETLLQQYKLVKERTSNNFTYNQGSHVMQYGALEVDTEPAGDYIGMNHTGGMAPSSQDDDSAITRLAGRAKKVAAPGSSWWGGFLQGVLEHVADTLAPMEDGEWAKVWKGLVAGGSRKRKLTSSSGREAAHGGAAAAVGRAEKRRRSAAAGGVWAGQRHADLLPLMAAATGSRCPRRRAAAANKLGAAVAHRRRADRVAVAAAAGMLEVAEAQGVALVGMVAAAGGSNQGGQARRAAAVEWVVAGRSPSRSGAVVDDWVCLRGMVQAWESSCGALGEYGMRYTRMLANLCNGGLSPAALGHTLASGPCQNPGPHQQHPWEQQQQQAGTQAVV